jgi:hypothetical protein
MCSIAPAVDFYLPWVQYIGLLRGTEPSEQLRLIRYDEFLALIPSDKWRYADEKSVYLSALGMDEYLKIYENEACRPIDSFV